MKSRTTARFRELLARLPREVQQQADAAYRLFQANSNHPSLRFKRIHPMPPIYSARVGIGYRAVGVMEGETIAWYWIGTHAEYDHLLKQI